MPSEIELPISQCPNCKVLVEDNDGFGVLAHLKPEGCGYCSHPSFTDGVCGCCGVPEWALERIKELDADILQACHAVNLELKANIPARTTALEAVGTAFGWLRIERKRAEAAEANIDEYHKELTDTKAHLAALIEGIKEISQTYKSSGLSGARLDNLVANLPAAATEMVEKAKTHDTLAEAFNLQLESSTEVLKERTEQIERLAGQKISLISERDSLSRENEKLQEDLKKYGRHLPRCYNDTSRSSPCVCGLNAALSPAPAQKKATTRREELENAGYIVANYEEPKANSTMPCHKCNEPMQRVHKEEFFKCENTDCGEGEAQPTEDMEAELFQAAEDMLDDMREVQKKEPAMKCRYCGQIKW